jgi:hypothetical protein
MKYLWLYQNRELYPIISEAHRRFLGFLFHEDDTWNRYGVRILCADPPSFTYRVVRACETKYGGAGMANVALPSPSPEAKTAWLAEPPSVWLRTGKVFRQNSPIWTNYQAWHDCLNHLRAWVTTTAWVWFDDADGDRDVVTVGVKAALDTDYHVSLETSPDGIAFWRRKFRVEDARMSFRCDLADWRKARSMYPDIRSCLWLQLDEVPVTFYLDDTIRNVQHVVIRKAVSRNGLLRYKREWSWTPAGKQLLRALIRMNGQSET